MASDSHVIRVEDSGEAFECREEESLLSAASRTGRRIILAGCRNGGCGVCKIRVLQGQYRTGKMSKAHVSDCEGEEGYALACRTLPTTSLKIEVCRRADKPVTSWSDK
ncbi:2Fe-2S iron-sulfur cluster-binding protein [Emcibacter nanhaiensis]|uniref:2Fe-2S iron-sulfur cluster binding domain-containing protein n=1 Tax=Emcibacter nanhaiensis TaxID=1505037 RepID=A0A501PIX6_9PROT|nr:2Fe-2S iron-sulfur cluster-binding protein [Emcibacter nanhaiensis]TPD59884.1 2Fe-2S iron-sulfur cluster binding domain-containing protein [Emcibacter nanhaiensis]